MKSSTPLPKSKLSYRIASVVMWPIKKLLVLTCRQFSQLASEKRDRELGPTERARFTMHKSMCSVCRNLDRQLQRMAEISKEGLEDNHQAPSLSTKRKEQILAKLREETKEE